MKIISVNVGLPRIIEINGNRVETGIFKDAVDTPLDVKKFNIAGDGQADLNNHGGEFKAVYVYPHEHYSTWQAELGRDDFTFGQFGENLTTQGLLEDEVYVGSIYRMGTALFQVTQPRVPCFKLGIRMNDPKIVKKFMQAQRTGFYVRVLEEGIIRAGDSIELATSTPQALTVRDINTLLYFEQDADLAKRALDIDGLTPSWRDKFQEIAASI
ncbi:MAG: hypothetical protein Phog2KO_39670 [Phototrophicaceae bacterium]